MSQLPLLDIPVQELVPHFCRDCKYWYEPGREYREYGGACEWPVPEQFRAEVALKVPTAWRLARRPMSPVGGGECPCWQAREEAKR